MSWRSTQMEWQQGAQEEHKWGSAHAEWQRSLLPHCRTQRVSLSSAEAGMEASSSRSSSGFAVGRCQSMYSSQ